MKVTKEMMIEVVKGRVEARGVAKKNLGEANSFAARGNATRLQQARRLLERLKKGEAPTPHEVTAYFGKGARFEV